MPGKRLYVTDSTAASWFSQAHCIIRYLITRAHWRWHQRSWCLPCDYPETSTTPESVWLSGNALVSISIITLCQALLVPQWVLSQVNHLGTEQGTQVNSTWAMPPWVGEVSTQSSSSFSRMRVMNHNWSAMKQRLHLQSVAEISRHSGSSGDRIRQCETSSGSRHKDTDQCL